MHKKITILLILALPLFLVGCTKLTQTPESTNPTKAEENANTKTQEAQEESSPTENTTTDTEANPTPSTDSKNVFTSIKDALARDLTLKCSYKADKGDTATAYIKGDKVYMEGQVALEGQTTRYEGLLRDNKYYFWSNLSTQGMLFDLTKMADGAAATGQKVETTEEVINKLEANKEACSVTTIADSKFEVPQGITFMEF